MPILIKRLNLFSSTRSPVVEEEDENLEQEL